MEEKIPLNFKPHTIEAQGEPMETLKQLVRDKAQLIVKRDKLTMETRKYKAIIVALRQYMYSHGLTPPRIKVGFVKVPSRRRRSTHMRVVATATSEAGLTGF